MAFDRVLQRLSSDDVLPAEGVQDVVDTANGNTAAFYVQHSSAAAAHIDYGPFIVARALVKVVSSISFKVVQAGGALARVSLDETLHPNLYGRRLMFLLMDGYRPTGASVCVRYTEAAIDLQALAPSIHLTSGREIAVQFDTDAAYFENSYIHVLIRGRRA